MLIAHLGVILKVIEQFFLHILEKNVSFCLCHGLKSIVMQEIKRIFIIEFNVKIQFRIQIFQIHIIHCCLEKKIVKF